MMHELVLVLLKATPESKEGVIQYFAEVIRINENRAKIQVGLVALLSLCVRSCEQVILIRFQFDRKEVSSDGFFMSVSAVLLRLSQPFLEVNSMKAKAIDFEYLYRYRRIDVSKETTLASQKETLPEILEQLRGRSGKSPIRYMDICLC